MADTTQANSFATQESRSNCV